MRIKGMDRRARIRREREEFRTTRRVTNCKLRKLGFECRIVFDEDGETSVRYRFERLIYARVTIPSYREN